MTIGSGSYGQRPGAPPGTPPGCSGLSAICPPRAVCPAGAVCLPGVVCPSRAVWAEPRPEWAEISHLACKPESPGKCLVKTQSLPPGHPLPTPGNSSSTAALAPQTEAWGANELRSHRESVAPLPAFLSPTLTVLKGDTGPGAGSRLNCLCMTPWAQRRGPAPPVSAGREGAKSHNNRNSLITWY